MKYNKMDQVHCTHPTDSGGIVKRQLKERYGCTFKQLCMLSEYSERRPTWFRQLQRIYNFCIYLGCKICFCAKEAQNMAPKEGIKIEHLKLWCQDKHMGPELTSGFFCKAEENHEREKLLYCDSVRKMEGTDTSCVVEIKSRQNYLNHIIDLSDIDKDGILSEDEFLFLMLKVHEACICEHKCVSLIDAVPKNSRWHGLGSAGTYICWPPPLCMLLITMTQIGLFCFMQINEKKKFGLATPMCSDWVLNPERRFIDPWRFVTYAFIHKDGWHLLSNVIGQMVLGFSLECADVGNHSSLRVAIIYFSGIIFGAIGRLNPFTLAIPRTPLVGSSGGLYALFGAHIAHVILNWEEDKIMFRGTCILNVSGQNILKPLPKKYAIKFRLARLLTLILWAIAEGCLGFYNKIAKCNKSTNNETDLNDFDEVGGFDIFQSFNETQLKPTGLCASQASYSTHFFGFATGLLIGLIVLKRRRMINVAIKVLFRTSIMLLFASIMFYLIFRNHERALINNEYRGFGQKNCTINDYETMCKAKCYCGWNQIALSDHPFYDHCQNFTICNWRDTKKFSYSSVCTIENIHNNLKL